MNNVPVKPMLREVMRGRIRRRNPFVLALDCFSPQLTSMWYPVQKMVVPNVQDNVLHADQYFPLRRRLTPINVVPTPEQAMIAMDWTAAEMQPLMPFITRMCASHADLPFERVVI